MEKGGHFHSAAVLITGKWMFSRAAMDVLEKKKSCVSAETRISIPRRPSPSTTIYIDWTISVYTKSEMGGGRTVEPRGYIRSIHEIISVLTKRN
jgi:hypothetical protein